MPKQYTFTRAKLIWNIGIEHDFPFMDEGGVVTSEGTDTLIFTVTSKTGQSVAHNRQNIFFFCLY